MQQLRSYVLHPYNKHVRQNVNDPSTIPIVPSCDLSFFYACASPEVSASRHSGIVVDTALRQPGKL
jgi:hypothetical protein